MLRAVIDIVPLGVTTTGWAVTVGLVLLLLAIDLALAVARQMRSASGKRLSGRCSTSPSPSASV